MRRNPSAKPGPKAPADLPVFVCEALLVALVLAVILTPQLTGAARVADEGRAVDERGLPTMSKTLEDLEKPGTRFGVLVCRDPEREPALFCRMLEGVSDRFHDGVFLCRWL